jgi:hypothetical protein
LANLADGQDEMRCFWNAARKFYFMRALFFQVLYSVEWDTEVDMNSKTDMDMDMDVNTKH